MFLILLLLHFFCLSSQAAPLSVIPREILMTDWSSSLPSCMCPDVHSVWDIIWSCFATIFACSWVSVHPNIPAPGEKSWRITLRRFKYMVWTILAPELVIYWAMRQYFGARMVSKEYQARGWTTTHGHFLQMGGFVLFDGKDSKGVLTLDAARPKESFSTLLRHKRIKFPSITKEEIEDQSKSNGLAKCLVIRQTGWFVLQCIVHRVEGLIITELELVTLALASLNAFMYYFWWDKPFDVRTQVPVYLIPEGHNVDSDVNVIQHAVPSKSLGTRVAGILMTTFVDWPKDAVLAFFRWMTSISFRNAPIIAVKIFISVFYRCPKVVIRVIFNRMEQITEWSTQDSDKYVVEGDTGISMFYSIATDSYTMDAKRLWIASAIGIAFGAIHCAAWHFIFPMRPELIIWRVCSVIIAAVPAILSVYSVAFFVFEENKIMDNNLAAISQIVRDLAKALSAISSPIYILARFALLVEALLTLRDLPQGAYVVVDWTARLPHI